MASKLAQAEAGQQEKFQDDTKSAFAVNLEGFEGPIDLLLVLVREKGFDLSRISVAQLAEQYLAFLANLPPELLQKAAEYLVMASWLAMLKSKLLLPRDELHQEEEDPSLMAERLAEKLRQLAAMQKASNALQNRPQLARDFFVSGNSTQLSANTVHEYPADLTGLVLAFRRLEEKRRHRKLRLRVSELPVISVEDARHHLHKISGTLQNWRTIRTVLPPKPEWGKHDERDHFLMDKSRLASTFMASLEMEREGTLSLRQETLEEEIALKQGHRTSKK